MPQCQFIKQHSRRITIYMKITGIQEHVGAVSRCNKIKVDGHGMIVHGGMFAQHL